MSPAEVKKLETSSKVAWDIGGDIPLDRWISYAVSVLMSFNIETFESCQGGSGHCYPEPTVRFRGGSGEGWKALGICVTYALPVTALRRIWTINDGEPTGPYWEITFQPSKLRAVQWNAERSGVLGQMEKRRKLNY